MDLSTKQKAQVQEIIEGALAIDDIAEAILQNIADTFPPDVIYSEEVLTEWAENNGFIKED